MKHSKLLLLLLGLPMLVQLTSCQPDPRPRVLVSTDIGGTDPDDNQSMAHLLMYSNRFQLEGLVSSPSYGEGSKEEILRMIDLYEKDLPQLKKGAKGYPTPNYLRSICKQGQKGLASFLGYGQATEGSDWIVHCARKKSDQPLWVLVWGGLEDVAQALHDAPDIQDNIRVYWIGGPNKKWGVNGYAYIVENFPDLWIIENNATYEGFIYNRQRPGRYGNDYYDQCIKGHGFLAEDFINYYNGRIKMGDTPSLLYMMDGDPADPHGDSWGGRFEETTRSARRIFNQLPTQADTVPVYSVMEIRLRGPELENTELAAYNLEKPCFKMIAVKQTWDGFYLGHGQYVIRYSPKRPECVEYEIFSDQIPEFPHLSGSFTVNNEWPGPEHSDNWQVGAQWFTDLQDTAQFDNGRQGAKTISCHRDEVLADWAELFGKIQ